METMNVAATKKAKRLTSVVWNHFERVKRGDVCYAVCVHCNKNLSGSSNSGTTHLRNHLMRCLERSNFDVSQLLSAKKKKKDATVVFTNIIYDEGSRKEDCKPLHIVFDQAERKDEVIGSGRFGQQRSQLDLARMIIMHGYPLCMVEHVGFKVFVKNLQPLFDIISNGQLELSCVEIYEKEKQKVLEMISQLHGRINIAVETWTSTENAEYMCLTAHYIDEDWNLQKKILNFMTLDSSYTNNMLSKVIINCLMDWHIECKLFAMTFDDCLTDDDIVIRIGEQITEIKPHFGSGQLFDIRSAADGLSLIVHDAMQALQEVNDKIRASIKFVKSSQLRQGKFNEIVRQVGIDSQKSLVIDCPTQWNSTYLMTQSALDYKRAFSLLQELDSSYTSALTDSEWEWASSVNSYLKVFVEITNGFSANKHATANIYFPEICHVHIQLIEWCKAPDDFLRALAFKMKAKFDKYWSKCILALALAAILDPRFKMKLVEYYYSLIYGSISVDKIKEVSDGIKHLFNVYSINSTLVEQGSALPGNSLLSTNAEYTDRLKGFDKFLHETTQNQSMISDLEKYLEEPVFPRNCDFNLLNWWRVHMPRYPILSMMARDILGTPMSTGEPDLAFNTGGRVLDIFQSSLSSDTRQALICARDWLEFEW